MFSDSRIDIYRYVESLLTENVTENVYLMNEPQELVQSDADEGFIVVKVGDIHDNSEFDCEAYGWARVFVETYVPPITRGRLNVTKYKEYEDAINQVVKDASNVDEGGKYWIQSESVLSMDGNAESNANNAYYMFVKSFVVMIGEETNSN